MILDKKQIQTTGATTKILKITDKILPTNLYSSINLIYRRIFWTSLKEIN